MEEAALEPVPNLVAIAGRPRITLEESGLTIWHGELFGTPSTERGRLFLSRVFSVEQIESVEIDRAKGLARLIYNATAKVKETLRALREILGRPLDADESLHPDATPADRGGNETVRAVAALYLDTPGSLPIRISRVGPFLSTWHVELQGEGTVQLYHPILKGRLDIIYRLEEELTAIQGVRDFRNNRFAPGIIVRFSPRRIDVTRLLRHLEYCWPRLINGLEGPLPRTRLIASSSLLTFAFIGQYFVPTLTPFVLVGVLAYGFANVSNAAKQLVQGKVGLPALYTGTLTFTTLSGMPFAATFMAVWMQLWPRWASDLLNHSQRRLFASHRQRATWARRLEQDGHTAEVIIDYLQKDDHIVVHEGEILPVDGVVVAGLAAVDEEVLTGRAGAFDKAPGDPVYAATYIKTGQITVKVKHIGVETSAGTIGQALPHGYIDRLPTSAEAELIANRMVLPAFALSGANLLLGGAVQPSQSTIRADYATGPRFAAQLATLQDLSDALRRGIVFRDPSALARLPATDIYVFDESPALTRRQISIEGIFTTHGVSATQVLSYVASAFPAFQNQKARALMGECLTRRAPLLQISNRARHAGSITYTDEDGHKIEVASPAFIEAQRLEIPVSISAAIESLQSKGEGAGFTQTEPVLRPFWVIRNGSVIGVVTFDRRGETEGLETIAVLKARNPKATFYHISSRPQAEAEEVAANLGIPTAYGGLDIAGKVDVLTTLGRRTMWIGDGSLPASLPCIEASTISISLGGPSTVPIDSANVILLQPTLRLLVQLRRIGRRHRALIKEGYRSVFAANLFCVAGAFFGGFNTLAVSIVSNIGTGYVYTTHRSLLNDLITRMEAKMAKEATTESGDHDAHEGINFKDHHEVEQHEDYADHDLDLAAPQTRPV